MRFFLGAANGVAFDELNVKLKNDEKFTVRVLSHAVLPRGPGPT
jgi:hypothetical protein